MGKLVVGVVLLVGFLGIVGCAGGGGSGGTTGGVPAGQIEQSAAYAVSGNLASGALAPAGSSFRAASAVTGNGTSITLSGGQLVVTGNVTTSGGTVPFYLTATATGGEVKSVTMTLGVGTTFTGTGTITAGGEQIVLALSNGTTITLSKQGVTKTGGPGTTAKAYSATLTMPRCDSSAPVVSGPMLIAFLPDDEVMVAWLATGNLLVATGTRTSTALSLAAVNLANGNLAVGSATTTDAFASLALSLQYCDTAGGCSCPPSRPLEATGVAAQLTAQPQ